MRKACCLLLSVTILWGIIGCSKRTETTWQEQYGLGMRYLSEGNYAEAIIAFTAAIDIDPKQADAYLGRAEAYFGIDEVDLAVADFEAAVAMDETNEAIYLGIADLCLSVERADLAVDFLQRGAERTSSEEILEQLDALQREAEGASPEETLDQPDSLLSEDEDASSGELLDRPDVVAEEVFRQMQAELAEDSVSSQPFLTSSGTEVYPFPDEAYGLVNSQILDIDEDGQPELISLISSPNGLVVWMNEMKEDGAVSSTELGTLQGPGYCSQMDVILFYNTVLNRYCIAASDSGVGAYTGTDYTGAWLYVIEGGSLSEYRSWDWAMIVHGRDELDTMREEMEALGWPYLEYSYYVSIINEESLKTSVWLLRTEIDIANADEMPMPTECVRYLRFLSPEELSALPNREE